MIKMSVTEMRMLKWMCGKIRNDIIRNVNIRDMVGVASIEDKLRKNRLRWYRQVYRNPIDAVVRRRNIIIGSDDTRGRGRTKLTFNAVVKNDRIGLNLNEHLALNRAQWRKRIRLANPN